MNNTRLQKQVDKILLATKPPTSNVNNNGTVSVKQTRFSVLPVTTSTSFNVSLADDYSTSLPTSAFINPDHKVIF